MTYPNSPGWKARDTARDAARDMSAKAPTLRQRVLAALKSCPGTPEEIAARLGEPLLSLRPRFSELASRGFIQDTFERRPSQGGKRSIVWEVKR